MAPYTFKATESGLHQTIAHIESRISLMDDSSDCMYERALVNSYYELLVYYGRKLFMLQSRRFLLSEPSAIIAHAKAQ